MGFPRHNAGGRPVSQVLSFHQRWGTLKAADEKPALPTLKVLLRGFGGLRMLIGADPGIDGSFARASGGPSRYSYSEQRTFLFGLWDRLALGEENDLRHPRLGLLVSFWSCWQSGAWSSGFGCSREVSTNTRQIPILGRPSWRLVIFTPGSSGLRSGPLRKGMAMGIQPRAIVCG